MDEPTPTGRSQHPQTARRASGGLARVRRIGCGTVLVIVAGLGLSGCLIQRTHYPVPAYHVPDQVGSAATPTAGQALGADFDSALWWQNFGNTELDHLIGRGLANNPDLRIALLHVAEARVRAQQAHGAQYPTLDAGLAAGPQHGNAPSATTSGATLSGAWSVDLWGEHAAAAREADLQLWQAEFQADNTRRMLVGSIATAYVDYLLANERMRTSQRTVELLAELMVTIERRVTAGDATLLEYEQQRSAMYAEQSALPAIALQRADAINTLSAALGTLPERLQLSDATLESVQVPGPVSAVPGTLLLRRSDVRAAEAQLLASDLDIDVMRARLLPALNLSAQTGYSGLLEQLIGPKSFFWNLFGNLSMNVFDDGLRSSNIEQARLVHEEQISNYGKTLLQAFRETGMALRSIQSADQRLALQDQALHSSDHAWEIARQMYLVGGADFMTLQDTERTYRRTAEDNQQLRASSLKSYISLYQALGGISARAALEPGAIRWPDSGTPAGHDAADPGGPSWQVQLDGIYQRDTVANVLLDLQQRYPDQMSGRSLYPALHANVSDLQYGQQAWYRLSAGKFTTLDQAQQFCEQLQRDLQRCQVTASPS